MREAKCCRYKFHHLAALVRMVKHVWFVADVASTTIRARVSAMSVSEPFFDEVARSRRCVSRHQAHAPGGDDRGHLQQTALEVWSGGRDDGDAVGGGGVGESFVVGDDALEVIAEIESYCEVQCVETPQSFDVEFTGTFEHRRRHGDKGERVEHPTSSLHLIGSTTSNCSEELGTEEVARKKPIFVLGRPAKHRSGSRFGDDQLHRRRSIHVKHH